MPYAVWVRQGRFTPVSHMLADIGGGGREVLLSGPELGIKLQYSN